MTTYTKDSKMMPQAQELEEIVLGALMIDNTAFEKVNLSVDDFYQPKHQKIFKAISQLSAKYSPIDMMTVTEQLTQNGDLESVGGAYQVASLTIKVASSFNIEAHANIIKSKSIARKLIHVSTMVQEMSYNGQTDIADVIEFLEKGMSDLSNGSTATKVYDIDETLEQTVNYMQQVQYNHDHGIQTCISTGLYELDKSLNGGWSAPDLIVLGGRPSMGKTQFAVKFAKEAANVGKKVLFASIEMTKIQIAIRLITENEAIDYYRIKTGQLSTEEWRMIDEKIQEISRLDLRIADDSNVNKLQNIKSIARSMKRREGLDLLIIDYLQLIESGVSAQNRDIEIGLITKQLKNLCKELNIPIILLAQLNRPQSDAKVPEPKLSNLRESGNIEQDADVVIFPHRPIYYDKEAVDSQGRSWENRGYLIIGKSREGEKDKRIYFRTDNRFKQIWDDDQIVIKSKDTPF